MKKPGVTQKLKQWWTLMWLQWDTERRNGWSLRTR